MTQVVKGVVRQLGMLKRRFFVNVSIEGIKALKLQVDFLIEQQFYIQGNVYLFSVLIYVFLCLV